MDYIITFFPYFRKKAEEEAAKSGGKRAATLAPHMSLFTFPAKAAISDAIFIRHICPVQYTDTLPFGINKTDAVSFISDAVKQTVTIAPAERFCVQCRLACLSLFDDRGDAFSAKDIEVAVGRHFDDMGALPVFNDTALQTDCDLTVISVVVVGKTFYIGASLAKENLSVTADEYRVSSRSGAREISRAENKLKEAISFFRLNVAAGRALDIGAAPGGWSKVLADCGMTVSAVDPAELSPALKTNPRITHIKSKIEDVTFDTAFDMVVCDLNVDPQTTARLLASIIPYVKPAATCVVTLKLPFSDVTRQLSESLSLLSPFYTLLSLKNLTHNRREVTAVLKPKT